MMRLLGNHTERCHRARKPHRCQHGRDCTIQPGDVYYVGVTLPGVGSYPIGGGDYETESWDFDWTKCCATHYAEMVGDL